MLGTGWTLGPVADLCKGGNETSGSLKSSYLIIIIIIITIIMIK